MKPSSSSVLCTLLATLVTGALPFSSAQAAPRVTAPSVCAPRRHTVTQFFNLLPARYFAGISRREKLGKKPVIDRAHDYMETRGEGDDAALDIRVFRFAGQETVGVFVTHADGGGELNFYRLQNGRLRDVTLQVLPRPFKQQVAELPRTGTTLRVLNRRASGMKPGTVASNLEWRGGRFVAKP
jgi:hypothetical protein